MRGKARTRKARRRTAWGISALILVVMVMMLAVGCGEEEETTTTAASTGTESTAPATEETTAPESTASETTAPEAGTPVSGGVLRLMHITVPQILGFWPKQGPSDEAGVYPAVEKIAIITHFPERKLQPELAESAEEDPDALTITVKLREGVLFHDGSELTSEVAKWNYDIAVAGGKFGHANDAIKEFEIVDKYSYVIHLNYWNNELYPALTGVPIVSKEAYEKNGEEWTMTHVVGTGPFMLEEFNRDQSVKYVRNPNYWRGEPYPYLDGVEQFAITDATTAEAIMEAGEADIWQGADAQSQASMRDKGFKLQSGRSGMDFHLIPNIVGQSCMADQRVREAVEYALDKPAINEAIGYGISTPLDQVAPETEPGVGPPKVKREYDPEKAKQLLAEAGYPDGCPIDILAEAQTGGRNTMAEAVKGYLDAAGFITNIDIADAGRFYASIFSEGWKDLAVMWSGSGTFLTYLADCLAWWGPKPRNDLASWEAPEEMVPVCESALMARTVDEQAEMCEQIVAYINEHALIIPLSHSPATVVVQDWVHSDLMVGSGVVGWSSYDDWMDPH